MTSRAVSVGPLGEENSDAKRALSSGGDDGDDTKCEEFPGGVARIELRPSFFDVPVVGLKALRARLNLYWMLSTVDPLFDEEVWPGTIYQMLKMSSTNAQNVFNISKCIFDSL